MFQNIKPYKISGFLYVAIDLWSQFYQDTINNFLDP